MLSAQLANWEDEKYILQNRLLKLTIYDEVDLLQNISNLPSDVVVLNYYHTNDQLYIWTIDQVGTRFFQADFNVENFKKEILSDKKNLNKLLRKVKIKPSELSDEEKINEVFKILYSTLANNTIRNFQEILKTSILEEILGFHGEKQKIFEKFIRRISRFQKNPEDFVKHYAKYFNFIGDRMIRKISKLYAITSKK